MCNVGIPHSVVSTHCNAYNAHCTELVDCKAKDNILLPLHEYAMREDHANSRQVEMMSIKAEPNVCISNDVAHKLDEAKDFASRLQGNNMLTMTGMSSSGEVLKSEANDNDEISVHEHIDTYCFSSSNTNTIIPDDYTIVVKQEIIDYDLDANSEVVKAPCLFEDCHLVKLERGLNGEEECSPRTTNIIDSDMDKVCLSTEINEQSVEPFDIGSLKDEIDDDVLNIVKPKCEYGDKDSNQCTYQTVTDPHSNEQPFVEIEIIKDQLGKCTELYQSESLDKTAWCVKLSSDGKPATECMKIAFSTKRTLKNRRNTRKRTTCTECDSYYDQERHSKSCVKRHCKSNNKNETETFIRTKTSKKPTRSVRSMKSHKIYKCIVCGKILSSKGNLTEHTRIHTGERPYTCLECGKTFTQRKAHDVHMRIHTGDKPFNCSECLRSFRYLPDCKKHSLACSQIEGFICQHCSRIFPNQEAYEEHLRMHAKHRPYQCTKCEKSFLTVAHVQRHQLVHTSKKIYQCFICDRSFGHSQRLHTHMKSHHNESIGLAKHSCHLCAKEFDDLEKVKEHQRVIHEYNYKERGMYSCEECGIGFSTKVGREVHAYRKHPKKELLLKIYKPRDDTICPVCNVQFSTGSNCNRHVRLKHRREVANS